MRKLVSIALALLVILSAFGAWATTETVHARNARWEAGDPALRGRMEFPLLFDDIGSEGLQGQKVVFGTAAFTTTGTTVEIPAYTSSGQDLATISSVVVFPKVAYANSDLPYADGDVTATGGAGNNTTTITRAAGTTSGMSFWFVIVGT